MKNSPVTIKDIASELNVSPSTVSRALKDHPDISEATKKAVTELAEKYHYQPNSIALSLRKSKTNIIGVIVPEIAHWFFSSIISGVEDIAYDAGYQVMICQSNESIDREAVNTQALMASRVDGLLISVSKETNHLGHLENILGRNIPLVFFDRMIPQLQVSSVTVDDYQGAFQAVEHLIQQGCRNICHLVGPELLLISQNRLNGYLDALRKYDLPIREDYILKAENYYEGVNQTRELLNRGLQPDGIFTTNDNVAAGAIRVLKENQIRIPQDIAVVGFSDDPSITMLIEPPLSSVSQPGFEMGQIATNLFLQQVGLGEDEPFSPEKKLLSTKLVVRASSLRNP